MEALGTELVVLAKVVAVEESEHPRDGRTAGEARKRDHPTPSVVDGLGWRSTRFVGREIFAREDPAERADVVGDGRGQLALVQDLRPAARDGFEGAREIGLGETVWRLEA